MNTGLRRRQRLTQVRAGTGQQQLEFVQPASLSNRHGKSAGRILVRDASDQWDEGTSWKSLLLLEWAINWTQKLFSGSGRNMLNRPGTSGVINSLRGS